MTDVNDLVARIDGAITAVTDKLKQQQQHHLKEAQARQRLVEEYVKVQAKVVEIARPRLEALAKRAGDRVSVTPTVTETRRAAQFEFRSPRAYITLALTVAPDMDVKNAVVEYDLKVVPVLWQFQSRDAFRTPVAAPDLPGLTKWLDDRIVGFVEFYVHIHEGEFFDKAEYVEDPVAKVKFPKFAAGATLEHGGQTHYFIDAANRAEFARQKGVGG